ncbi:PREDICTED: trihelix transcription factor PTL-like [Nelumbo nucifera]|uniref:Trihelix transcription factor PTL-like n=1 Tax=Nelumbo nucifera TaxID=4432 RepID=A0A1U8BMF1_NELNU|nr:PREDICTED: trihelix transcription factor PTL-like [Nelumbo nucifera]
MEMGDQYGLPDLRQLMAGRSHFPVVPQPTEQFPGHRNLTAGQHYEMMLGGHHQHQVGEVLPRGVVDFRSDSNPSSSAAALCGGGGGGLEMEVSIGGDGGNGRWPRQETLTLLEIRSRLDPKFKEANQKGPLWDEVSRIMAEEHGYQRSGKKCREKFENLYKYYKKTKEGKAGRQDGKHYRFFRQLEALYGESSNPVSVSETRVAETSPRFRTTNNSTQEALQAQKFSESLSLSNSSELDSSSSEDNGNDLNAIAYTGNDWKEKKKMMMMMSKDCQGFKRGRRSWKSKIREFVDSQMRKLMETQEAWLEKMLKTLEHKEQERMSREEEWRRQEAARLDREQKFWAKERAWIEARDAALMEALRKFTGRELKSSFTEELVAPDLHDNSENQNENVSETLDSTMNSNRWPEQEISSLIQLGTSMESRIQHGEFSKGGLWEEISAKMACLGYNRSAKQCKEKWEIINKCFRENKECNKKRKENSRTYPCSHNLDTLYNQGRAYSGGHDTDEQGPDTVGLQPNDAPSPSNSNAGATTTVHDSCFRYLMAEGENLWENYGVRFNKGENHMACRQ